MQETTGQNSPEIKSMMQRVDELASREVTASVREKLDGAQSLYAEYRAGHAGEAEIRELLENITRDPEIRALQNPN